MDDSERSGTFVLESFEAPENLQVTTFETDELTALCPFDFGGPDFYELTIRYEADERCLESRSLKRWLESFRDKEATAEELADEIHWVVNKELDPERLYIRLEQARRGGISETVEVGDRALC
jgi:7-cyano-7-deazaguanine reductase